MDKKTTFRAGSGRRLTALAGVMLATAGMLAGGGHAASAQGYGHRLAHTAWRALLLPGGPRGQIGQFGRPGGLRSQSEPFSLLRSVYCTSPANCWAVGLAGSGGGAVRNDIWLWNGSQWRRTSSPNPGGTGRGDFNALFGVRCTVARDCWAVGVIESGRGPYLGEALHWNGEKWSATAVPDPGGLLRGDFSELYDVACAARSTCWAVGQYGTETGGFTALNLAMRWNGKRWALAQVPDPGGTVSGDTNQLAAIRCPSRTMCLAIGILSAVERPNILLNQGLLWNGKRWSTLPMPEPATAGAGDTNQLYGLACSSASNCFAVGAFGNSAATATIFNQILHWNGTTWSAIDAPQPDGASAGATQQLASATCASATDCWAVGNLTNPADSPGDLNQALHWDGAQWSLVPTPDPGGDATYAENTLFAIRCVVHASCWAVGVARVPDGPNFRQILHWDGSTWSAR